MVGSLTHEAMLYDGPAEFVSGIAAFLKEAVAAGQPVLVAVPGPHLELLTETLDHAPVEIADMGLLGRNPARIIPAVRRFVDAHPGQPCSFVGEPIWAGRSAAEIDESTRHEALLNHAFAGEPLSILCPYDSNGLRDGIIADALRTHPTASGPGPLDVATDYADPASIYAAPDPPLATPPVQTTVLPFADADDLPALRAAIRTYCRSARLTDGRIDDVVLSVDELASNTIRHGGGPGILRIWHDARALSCEIEGPGQIRDPLAGRRPPAPDADRGRGLWLINTLCDLTQIRTGPQGTTVRFRLALTD